MAHHLVTLGALLRDVGITREHLAERLGVSTQTIHNWSQGRYPILPRQLGRLADSLLEAGAPAHLVDEFITSELARQGLQSRTFRGPSGSHPKDLSGPVVILAWRLDGMSKTSYVASVCRMTMERLGHRCIVIDCGGKSEFVQEAIAAALDLKPAGMVVFVPGVLSDTQASLREIAATLTGAGICVVFGQYWSDPHEMPPGVAAIRWDGRALARLAIETFLDLGHSAVSGVFAGAELSASSNASELKQLAEQRGLNLVGEAWVQGSREAGQAVKELIAGSTAVFASTVPALTAVVQACYELGLQWPGDISLLTVGTEDLVPRLGPAQFTVIELPLYQIGQQAAQMLLDLVRDPNNYSQPRLVTYDERSMRLIRRKNGSLDHPSRARSRAITESGVRG